MTVRTCLLAGWLSCLGANVVAPQSMAQAPDRSEPRRINLTPSESDSTASANQKAADGVAAALSRNGQLRGYHIDVVVVDGVAELHGNVADATQRDIAGRAALAVAGVTRVQNQLSIANNSVAAASQEFVPNLPPGAGAFGAPNGAPFPPAPQQVMPPLGAGPGLAPGMGMPMPGGQFAPEPAPAFQNQPGMMPNPQYQPPPLPPYAWPTYAPHNNYSRVAHPLQYAYNQWPFIGPMYPYPKIPLGWRRITLEWQDGSWWYGRESTSHSWWRVRYW